MIVLFKVVNERGPVAELDGVNRLFVRELADVEAECKAIPRLLPWSKNFGNAIKFDCFI